MSRRHDKLFAGKVVIVTGAGRGIGRGIAEEFAVAGAQVMLAARTLSYAEEARAAIRDAGGTAEIFQLDVKDKTACHALVAATAQHFGGIDVIVHAAADIPHGGIGQVSDDALDAGFDSIAKAAWWLLEAARSWLSASVDGGRFIAIGSICGPITTVPGMTAYAMAKSALDGFVRGAALDLARENITVNAVLPGLIASSNALRVLGADGLAAYGATMPVPRAGTPADVAHACLFLASTRSSYITGTSIKVDGGSTLATNRAGGLLDAKLKQQAGH